MTVPQPYDQFDTNQSTVGDRHRWKRYGALICGVLQISLATHMIGIGIMKDALYVPTWGVHAFIGGTLSIVAGAFGIQYSRSGMKCPTIASLVLSLMTTGVMVSGLIVNCIVLYAEEYVDDNITDMIESNMIHPDSEHELMIAELTIRHTIGYAAEASAGVMIFACAANMVASMLQTIFASLTVCTCCQKQSNNAGSTYMTNNPLPHEAGAQYGTQVGNEVMHMSSRA